MELKLILALNVQSVIVKRGFGLNGGGEIKANQHKRCFGLRGIKNDHMEDKRSCGEIESDGWAAQSEHVMAYRDWSKMFPPITLDLGRIEDLDTPLWKFMVDPEKTYLFEKFH